MASSHPKDPLHGVTLEAIVRTLVERFGWEELGRRIPVRCFTYDPSVKSSLTFLRKTPWARAKVEELYLRSQPRRKPVARPGAVEPAVPAEVQPLVGRLLTGTASARGAGIRVLFQGGTPQERTLAATTLARELGRTLLRFDLTGVENQFIGETEKNLAAALATAKPADVVLFFDEADALFGRRTSVRDAHDRYANQEVAYLVQRLAAHDGLVILATNRSARVEETGVLAPDEVVSWPETSAEPPPA